MNYSEPKRECGGRRAAPKKEDRRVLRKDAYDFIFLRTEKYQNMREEYFYTVLQPEPESWKKEEAVKGVKGKGDVLLSRMQSIRFFFPPQKCF
jgi:hypothetical protein